MQNTLTIAGRQFRSYFNGPVAYIVIALSLLIVGFAYWDPFFLMNRASVREMFRFLSYILIVAAPAVTMGLLADERRSGTLELLITMPVRESEVIFGKFLGAVGLIGVLLLCTLPYPISVEQLGDLDWGQVFTGYLGLFFQGSAMVALGLAASSFTDNQLVAFFVATFVFLAFAIMNIYLPLFPSGMITLIEGATFDSHRESMGRGVIDSRDVLYFVSFTGIFLMLAFRALESRRWS
jgi:ABC-2 type transport system permease protein